MAGSRDETTTAALSRARSRVPRLRFRPFAGDADVAGLATVMQVAFAADGLDWYPTPGSLANELAHSPNEDPRRDAVVAEVDGRIVAFGRAGWSVRGARHVYHTSGEVLPEFRRLGIGGAILRAEQARLREIAKDHPQDADRVFAAEVIEGQHGAEMLLSRDGYGPVRWFWEMSRPLAEPIEPLDLPSGLELRPLRPEDHRRVFAAEAEAFRDHWEHREWTDEDYAWAFGDPDLDTSLWRVAWDGDDIAGVVAAFVYKAENEALGLRRGWLERVSVRRPWRARGLASALMTSAMLELRARDIDTATLAVDADNPTGAVGVYERLGFRRSRGGTVMQRPMDPRRPAPGAP